MKTAAALRKQFESETGNKLLNLNHSALTYATWLERKLLTSQPAVSSLTKEKMKEALQPHCNGFRLPLSLNLDTVADIICSIPVPAVSEVHQPIVDNTTTPPKRQPAVSEGEIDKTIERIEDMNPYKESGNRDSYSEYNEGWSDACDVLGQAIKELLNVNVLRNISLNVQGEAQQRYEKAIEAAGMYLLEHMEEDIDYALFARHVAKIAAGLKEGGER